MKIAAIVIIGLVVALIGSWASGIRVLVIQPIGAIPNGITAIVYDVPNMRFIDSPDAICQRSQGGVSLLCRGAIAAAIANRGTILVRLPFSETLYWMTGAPEVDR